MITELIIAYAVVTGYKYITTSKERKIKKDFESIMTKSGISNKDYETFEIYDLESTSYGYVGYITNTKGLSLDHLLSKINILEDNLNAIITFEKDRFTNYIKMYMVDRDISDFKYTPVKCNSNELYVGKDFKGNDYKLNINLDPHLLIGGTTGTGKTMLLSIILTNLIYNSSKLIEIYLLQVMKSELFSFQDCNCVKGSASTMSQCNNILDMILLEMDKRSNLFNSYGVRNISQYNKYHSDECIKHIFIVIEELSFFINDIDVLEKIIAIAKAGRSVGIHIISCIQRTTATNMPPDLKSQMTRITFRQKSAIDSNNIINTSDAVKLKQREFILDGNNNYIMLKAPFIDDDFIILNKYVSEIKIPTKEQRTEVLNVKKLNSKIYTIDESQIIDIEDEDVIELSSKGLVQERKIKRTGVISLEDFKNANKKG